MEIKNLEELLEIVKKEDVDKVLLEYMLILIGAKETLSNVRKLVTKSRENSISKMELMRILNNENIK